jgi:hypothetical protein
MQTPSANQPTKQDGESGLSEEMRSDAKHLGTSAANRIHSELDARKGTAAQQAKSLSSAVQYASQQLDADAPQWLRSAFQQGADQVRRFADTLETKDSRQMLSEIQAMARDNPGMFLAASAALGFAAARIFKAGAPDSGSSMPRSAQRPPLQTEEPKFRPTTAVGGASIRPAGEFA